MIVPMKRAVIVCLKQDRDTLLSELQQCGELMLIRQPEASEDAGADAALLASRERQTEELLKRTKAYQPKKGMFSGRPEATVQDFLANSEASEQLREELAASLDSLAALESERASSLARQKLLEPWAGIHTPAEAVSATSYTAVFTGYSPLRMLGAIQAAAEQNGGQMETFGTAPDGLATVIACLRPAETALRDALKTVGFTESALPVRTGTAREELQRLSSRMVQVESEITAQQEAISTLSNRADELRFLSDQYRAGSERANAPVEETAETVYLEGWVRSDRTERLEKAVRKAVEIYDLAFYDPNPEDEPPTVSKNNWFITQFETITDMFSRPQYTDLDPNPVMGWWYWIIFGMMMGDVGYGILMLVFIGGFKWLKKPRGDMGKLVNVLFYASIPSIIFGVIFGSYFGETWNPLLFGPLDNPIGMLLLALGIGVLHIFSGMILKMITDIRAGKLWDAIFDQLTWIFIITGLIVFAAESFLHFWAPLATIGIVMAVLGAVTILFTGGRGKKGIGRVTGGLMGLYGITSFLSDILSYARIMALGLATGVIGMVMNILAGLVRPVPIVGILLAIIIYIIGHLFNLAMSLLSAYVHDSRLQYIEFYGKFYEGGGVEFKPLALRTQYVDITTGGAPKTEQSNASGQTDRKKK